MDNLKATNRMVRLFIATGFVYLIIATVLLALNINGIIKLDNDPIFMLALYGFVTQVIFGVSYIFVPGVSHTRYASYKSNAVEYTLLNAGIITLIFSMLILRSGTLALAGASALILSVLIHAANMWYIALPKKITRNNGAN